MTKSKKAFNINIEFLIVFVLVLTIIIITILIINGKICNLIRVCNDKELNKTNPEDIETEKSYVEKIEPIEKVYIFINGQKIGYKKFNKEEHIIITESFPEGKIISPEILKYPIIWTIDEPVYSSTSNKLGDITSIELPEKLVCLWPTLISEKGTFKASWNGNRSDFCRVGKGEVWTIFYYTLKNFTEEDKQNE